MRFKRFPLLVLPILWGSIALAAAPGADPEAGLGADLGAQLGDRLPAKAHHFAARPAGKPATIFLWYADGTPQPEDGPYCTGLKPPAWHCTFGVSSDDCKRKIQGFLDRWYADFNVVFTLSRPRLADYYTMIITSTNAWCSLNTMEAGVAPFNCNDNPGQSAFAFECGYDAHDCALIIAHEHAHMVGLDHTDSPADMMYPNTLPTIDGFEDLENRAPDALCTPKQNSYRRMLEQLGPWPGGEKPSPFSPVGVDAGAATPAVDAGKTDVRSTGGGGTDPYPVSDDGGTQLVPGYDAVARPVPRYDGGPPIRVPAPSGSSGCAFAPHPRRDAATWLAICLPLALLTLSRRGR